jgi:hypothetical protein
MHFLLFTRHTTPWTIHPVPNCRQASDVSGMCPQTPTHLHLFVVSALLQTMLHARSSPHLWPMQQCCTALCCCCSSCATLQVHLLLLCAFKQQVKQLTEIVIST